jgi:HAMP domain-containing protein
MMRTVRARLVFFGTLMMLLALFLVGVLFDRTVRNSRTKELEQAALTKLDAMCEIVKVGAVPRPLPADRDSLLLVQVLDPNGGVVGSTANVMDMDQPFIDPQQHLTGFQETRQWKTRIDDKPYLLVGQRVGATPDANAVYVAAPYSDVERLSSSLRRQMLLWAPLLAFKLAIGLLILVISALRPVDTMRRQLDAIGSSDLERRVTEPGTKDEIGRLAATMNRLLGRLEASSDQQARFVSDASHELRTPLAVSRTRLEVGLRRPESTDWPRTAAELLRQNQRMERLVTDLLQLAKGGVSTVTNEPGRGAELPVAASRFGADYRRVQGVSGPCRCGPQRDGTGRLQPGRKRMPVCKEQRVHITAVSRRERVADHRRRRSRYRRPGSGTGLRTVHPVGSVACCAERWLRPWVGHRARHRAATRRNHPVC